MNSEFVVNTQHEEEHIDEEIIVVFADNSNILNVVQNNRNAAKKDN